MLHRLPSIEEVKQIFSITLAPVREKLDEYLPQENRGTMLVTSRNRSAALKMTKVNQRVIRVPQMSDIEAFQLLQAKLPKGMTDDEYSAAIELVRALDNLPLAIVQASAYIGNGEDMTVADYLDLFDEQENQAELLNCDEGGEDRREKYVPSSVSKTLEYFLRANCARRR